LNAKTFESTGMSQKDLRDVVQLLRKLRISAGDFSP
jgi:hypothetical protein